MIFQHNNYTKMSQNYFYCAVFRILCKHSLLSLTIRCKYLNVIVKTNLHSNWKCCTKHWQLLVAIGVHAVTCLYTCITFRAACQ